MKVYVITAGEYSDYCIQAVTLNREKAGDRSADVFKYDKNGIPIEYINCKVNIIDSWW